MSSSSAARGRPANPVRGLVAGVVGGVVGSWAMNRYDQWVHAVRPDGPASSDSGMSAGRRGVLAQNMSERGGPAAAKAGTAVLEWVARRPATAGERRGAGRALHYAFGAGMGAFYGLVAEGFGPITWGRGALAGVALWAVADEVAVPAVGLAEPAGDHAWPVHAHAALTHALYGIVVEGVRRVLR